MKVPRPQIFVSYSHADNKDIQELEKHVLKPLSQLSGYWYDRHISAGANLQTEISKNLERSNIFILAVSSDFLASPQCELELEQAQERSKTDRLVTIIPVILHPCAWQDDKRMQNLLALPDDGTPIHSPIHHSIENAWMEVYQGVKQVVETQIQDLSKEVNIEPEFAKQIQETSFVASSKGPISLDEIFVFPTMFWDTETLPSASIGSFDPIVNHTSDICIVGDAISGKTTFAIKLFLELLERKCSTIFIDLTKEGNTKPSQNTYKSVFYKQFSGSFEEWWKSDTKVAVIDNLTSTNRNLEHLDFCRTNFSKIFVTISRDEYVSYFGIDSKLTSFSSITLESLSNVGQENLVRNWLRATQGERESRDYQLLDRLETQIRTVLIDKRVFPRYPYFVLSILQVHDASLAERFQLSVYGHAHYVIILALLKKAGVSMDDGSVATCLNFAREAANELCLLEMNNTSFDANTFAAFITDYKKRHIIDNALVRRMCDVRYGIFREFRFRTPYIYYYFLGSYLAEHFTTDKEIFQRIEKMADDSYLSHNSFALLSLVHHSESIAIIDEVLIRTMIAFDDDHPVTLDTNQMKTFQDLLSSIPVNVLTSNSVEAEREQERRRRDEIEASYPEEDGLDKSESFILDTYRVVRNVRILSQILRNKYGVLERIKVQEIISEVVDSGLRIVSFYLLDSATIENMVKSIRDEYVRDDENVNVDEIVVTLKRTMFLLTVSVLGFLADSLSISEIRMEVFEVLRSKDNRACKIIEYLVWLSTVKNLDENNVNRIFELLKEIDDALLRRLVSIFTQRYLNTHTVKQKIRQRITSRLIAK